ncbi:MAG: cysteine synthase family protein [Chloroflexota bacterium]|nr:cysteine synthase family protein [Chloroflexota bacterium]
MAYSSILDTIGNTPLVELRGFQPSPKVRIFAKLEGQNPTGSVKDRIAKLMLEKAELSGELSAEKTILEPSSGNTGVSLAMIANYKGYKVEVVMPDNVTSERQSLIESFGATITFSDGEKGTNGAIEVAKRMVAENPDKYLMLYQYGNEANPEAHYSGTAQEIIDELPDVDVFIAGLGTGGSLTGAGHRLKENNANTRIIAVVPHPEERIQGLRSLEDGFIPPILDEKILDGQFIITSEESFEFTKRLLEKESIFAGISSGAVLACALRVAEKMESGNIVCLFADGGWKYLSTGVWTKPIAELEAEIGKKIWW